MDGTGLKVVVQDGATDINIVGDWVYYTMLVGGLLSDMATEPIFRGEIIARVMLDGSKREVLTSESSRSNGFDFPTAMPDGGVYYRSWRATGSIFWYKL